MKMTEAPSTPNQSVFALPTSTAPPAASATPEPSIQATNPPPLPASKEENPFPLPKLRLEIRDLNHAGALKFLTSVTAPHALATSIQSVLTLLYRSPADITTTAPPTRSVTLVLRPMPGVAYTTGSELDAEHKEIHFSLDYIHDSVPASRATREIMGVLTHEMVHCYQYNGHGACPGGLVEGVADWVRLHAGLSPPHWREEGRGKWDAGYQHTGYFLEYLEVRYGVGFVRRLNEKLRVERYEEKAFWTELCGRPVEQLWGDYQRKLEEKGDGEEEECVLVEKEDASIAEPTPTSKDATDDVAKVPAGVV